MPRPASRSRSTTYISLKSGSCTVTAGSSANCPSGRGRCADFGSTAKPASSGGSHTSPGPADDQVSPDHQTRNRHIGTVELRLSSNCNSLCFFVRNVGVRGYSESTRGGNKRTERGGDGVLKRGPGAEDSPASGGCWPTDSPSTAGARWRSARVHPGERVLDVGCGFGETTIALARATGSALGIDCCEPFLAVGRADAARAGVGGAGFQLADGQTVQFEQPFDVCFARFGTMFFVNPAAAMANLRRATRPGGRLLMIVWRRIEDNAPFWMAKQIARRHLPPPADEAPSCGPGPFSMADSQTTGAVLKAAEMVGGRVRAGRRRHLDRRHGRRGAAFSWPSARPAILPTRARSGGERPIIVEELAKALSRFQTPSLFMPPAPGVTAPA